MINKPHAVAVRLTPEEFEAITHVMLCNRDKNITTTLRRVIEPLIAEGVASLAVQRKKAAEKEKREAKKRAVNGL